MSDDQSNEQCVGIFLVAFAAFFIAGVLGHFGIANPWPAATWLLGAAFFVAGIIETCVRRWQNSQIARRRTDEQ